MPFPAATLTFLKHKRGPIPFSDGPRKTEDALFMRRACSIHVVYVRFRSLFETYCGMMSSSNHEPHMASDAGAFTVLTFLRQGPGRK